jgi:hypothetical protein
VALRSRLEKSAAAEPAAKSKGFRRRCTNFDLDDQATLHLGVAWSAFLKPNKKDKNPLVFTFWIQLRNLPTVNL